MESQLESSYIIRLDLTITSKNTEAETLTMDRNEPLRPECRSFFTQKEQQRKACVSARCFLTFASLTMSCNRTVQPGIEQRAYEKRKHLLTSDPGSCSEADPGSSSGGSFNTLPHCAPLCGPLLPSHATPPLISHSLHPNFPRRTPISSEQNRAAFNAASLALRATSPAKKG